VEASDMSRLREGLSQVCDSFKGLTVLCR
jgi:hypothetical protein